MTQKRCGIEGCDCPDIDDAREGELNKILNTMHVAESVKTALREDRARELTARDLKYALIKADNRPWPAAISVRFPDESVDIPKLFQLLAQVVCPPVCVGEVNASGWHQLCEQKAQDAIRALGFTPPDLTPIPPEGRQ